MPGSFPPEQVAGFRRNEWQVWAGILTGGLGMKKTVHPRILELIKRYGDYSSTLHHRNAPMPHWYLLSIAVDRQYQGMGFSRKLMDPVMRHFDEHGQSCFLETHNPKNVAFYERYNFKVVELGMLPGSDKTHWAMLRKPQ